MTLTSLDRSGLYKALQPLRDSRMIVENEARVMRIGGGLGRLIGVDVTLSRIKVAITDFDYALMNHPPEATVESDTSDPGPTLEAIADLVAGELRHVHAGAQEIVGLGLGLPGPVNRIKGAPDAPEILPRWRDVDVGGRLRKLLADRGFDGIPAVVANDASLGALGVYTQLRLVDHARAPDDLVYVRVATGIGAGLVMKGHLVTGADGFAGEPGGGDRGVRHARAGRGRGGRQEPRHHPGGGGERAQPVGDRARRRARRVPGLPRSGQGRRPAICAPVVAAASRRDDVEPARRRRRRTRLHA
jgi:hypothetical protein